MYTKVFQRSGTKEETCLLKVATLVGVTGFRHDFNREVRWCDLASLYCINKGNKLHYTLAHVINRHDVLRNST